MTSIFIFIAFFTIMVCIFLKGSSSSPIIEETETETETETEDI